MNPAMWISKTGIQAQDAKLQSIANNLANVNTTGFKRDRLVFEDLAYRAETVPGGAAGANTNAPLGVQLGTGTRLVGTEKIFTDGNLQTTGQELDVAIVGKGFLQVQLANGETAYTRAGNLQRNAEGVLTNAQGLPLVPEIVLPAEATGVSIAENGMVSVTLAGVTGANEVGQIQIAAFVNPAGLQATGDNLFVETVASGPATEGDPGTQAFGKLKQRQLEASNVLVVEEMVEMITAQRTYEMSTKVLTAADGMLQQLAQAAR